MKRRNRTEKQSGWDVCCSRNPTRHCEGKNMPIILRLDRVMADRKMSLNELAARVGISNVNLSNLKTGKVKAVRFSTLEAICEVLDCQPGDILEYAPKTKTEEGRPER